MKLRNLHCRAANQSDGADIDTFTFVYLAEGAANAVFKIVPLDSSSQRTTFVFTNPGDDGLVHTYLSSKVLRISMGRPKTLRYKDIVDGYTHVIAPLFDTHQANQYLMDPFGVSMASEVVEHLHAQMHVQKPDQLYDLEHEALLLPDLSSEPGSSLSIEIKPKWLAQSPNAPQHAINCRTCALHVFRQASSVKKAYFCPLNYLRKDQDAITKHLGPRVAKELARCSSNEDSSKILYRLVLYLISGPGHDLLLLLRQLQMQHDPVGVLNLHDTSIADSSDQSIQALRIAMTLRDCSLFIQIPYKDQTQLIVAKLADLDLKSPKKVEDWAQKEAELVHGGWYTSRDGTDCALHNDSPCG